ncbi:glycosyltransferase family 4 protein [Lacinutrix iliipiscaria]|uniref:Glycosyltransferase family 4 protein n=1 Tax=Lacinutrix iliipiscaria TaxID=1230532 RepID=A0ABW5WNY9_9FLAO
MSVTKKNIVIVTSEFPPQPGGIGNHAYNLALYLSKNKFCVQVIADQRSENGGEEMIFDKELPFEVIRIKRYDFRFKMYVKRVAVTYKSLKQASHVIATGKFSLWNVALSSLFYKCKTLAVVHGTEVNFKTFTLKKSIDIALKKMDTVIAVSNYTKDLISHLKRHVEVIPNGIDLKKWEAKDVPELAINGNPILTTVGRVSSRKGQLNVIKQLPELIKRFPKLHYHCIGIPTEAEAFKLEARALNVYEYITFHGSLDELVLKQILKQTDVFVMLSSESETGDVEGFGIAILEANALGIPAIGSKGCGIEDAVNTGVSGVLIDSNQTSEFIKGIEQILNNKNAYQSGAKSWAEQHDWSNIIKRYITFLT